MGSVKDYFSSLGTGIASLLKGMQVTGKELVTRKITEEYPDNRLDGPAAPRFRAELRLKYDAEGNHKCIACGTCERNCPNGTIKIESKMVDTLAGKKKKLDRYIYDLGSGTFCKLNKKPNYLPEKEEPAPTPEQIAAAEAARQAKIEAAKAAAAKAKAAREAAAKAAEGAADAPVPEK